MRVFVTGATGFIGSAVVRELLAAGHEVLGLARNDEGAGKLARAGVGVHRGDLVDLASLVAGVQACDGVIHLAFIHDFSQYAASVEVDRRAVEEMAKALEGSDKPLVITSGTALLAPGRRFTCTPSSSSSTTSGHLWARATCIDIRCSGTVNSMRLIAIRPPSGPCVRHCSKSIWA